MIPIILPGTIFIVSIYVSKNKHKQSNHELGATGGSKGIGYGIADALSHRNFDLVLIRRNQVDLESAKNLMSDGYEKSTLEFSINENLK